MNHGSLFSGIGGFDLAAQWLGWNNVFQVEIDPYCQGVLTRHFPNTIIHPDIKELDGEIYRNKIDVLSGGFPCQPWSQAGPRKGEQDERHLWPQFKRLITEIQPTYIVGENVHGFVSYDGGRMLDTVCDELEDEGYEVWTMVFPASACNARHKRNRCWILAYSAGNGRQRNGKEVDTRLSDGKQVGQSPLRVWEQDAPTRTSFCGMADDVPQRLERNKALGNAIVPHCAYAMFRGIARHAGMVEELESAK